MTLIDRILFYIPDQASYVFTRTLRGKKGSDASNIHDEEVNDEVFSVVDYTNANRKENSRTMRRRSNIEGT